MNPNSLYTQNFAMKDYENSYPEFPLNLSTIQAIAQEEIQRSKDIHTDPIAAADWISHRIISILPEARHVLPGEKMALAQAIAHTQMVDKEPTIDSHDIAAAKIVLALGYRLPLETSLDCESCYNPTKFCSSHGPQDMTAEEQAENWQLKNTFRANLEKFKNG